jgi:hypothetical protein
MPRRLPLTRLGLLLMVGSLAVSALRFYIAFASEAADMGKDLPADRHAVWEQFLRNFLFAGSAATFLFWGGMALMLAGIARNLFWRR